jgi:hypothetical protein
MEILGISVTEWAGYLASLFVLMSFLMKNIVTLRYVNSIGCLFFVAYGILLATSWPIIITNVAIVCVNFYYLFISNERHVPADEVKP